MEASQPDRDALRFCRSRQKYFGLRHRFQTHDRLPPAMLRRRRRRRFMCRIRRWKSSKNRTILQTVALTRQKSVPRMTSLNVTINGVDDVSLNGDAAAPCTGSGPMNAPVDLPVPLAIEPEQACDVAIIGSGFAGLGMGIRLKQ
ncbi:MAG: hypothetical protein INH13_29220, partial [Cupriavidus sp.]|nr:hypothetical protein [Cupriavidus sp.]